MAVDAVARLLIVILDGMLIPIDESPPTGRTTAMHQRSGVKVGHLRRQQWNVARGRLHMRSG
jgi:hypothetical protein